MRDKDYYPAGAYNDPSAPYNEISIPEKEFELDITVTLTKKETVWSDDYALVYDDGTGITDVDSDNTDFTQIYADNCISIQQLLADLERRIEKDLADDSLTPMRKSQLRRWLAATKGWQVEETEIDY
jgi:hypothetical protein